MPIAMAAYDAGSLEQQRKGCTGYVRVFLCCAVLCR